MKRIRGGSGLGDSIYLRPIAEHFVRAGEKVTVLSNYPDIFDGAGAAVEPFSRNSYNVLAHYVAGKENPATTQWDDVCRSAGVVAPFRFDWSPRNLHLVQELTDMAAGRPIILTHGGRAPMGRLDGFAMEMLPARSAFESALAALADCFLVGVGTSVGVQYQLPVEHDLSDRTSVSDLLDIAHMCAGVVAQCSFAVPLAEVFGKPLLAIWGAAGLVSAQPYLRTITPRKIFASSTSIYAMDDWSLHEIQEVARAFRQF